MPSAITLGIIRCTEGSSSGKLVCVRNYYHLDEFDDSLEYSFEPLRYIFSSSNSSFFVILEARDSIRL